jgi:hypothetical protein
MSLHKIAKHLEAAGRNNDSMLVHMSPREVSGLQALARTHGGDLSINPNTGLVEAGFLDSILPMLAGAALTATGIGAPLAAGIVGAGTGLASGSVEKGLMAGLGAYGGANIGTSLAEAGGSAAAPETVVGATPTPAPTVSAGSPIVDNALNPSANNMLGTGFTNSVPPNAMTPSFSTNNILSDAAQAQGPLSTGTTAIPQTAANTFSGSLDKMGTGFSDVTSSMDKLGDFASQNKGSLLMSAAPMAYSMMNPNSSLFSKDEPAKGPEKKKITDRPYKFSTEQDPNAYLATDSSEQNYFVEPRFTALPTTERFAKEGGLMGYALGGSIPDSPSSSIFGGNSMYPQSQTPTPIYSNPMLQRTSPTEVTDNNYARGGMTGGLRAFADGGFTGSGAIDLHVPINLGGNANYSAIGSTDQSGGQGVNGTPYAQAAGNNTAAAVNTFQNFEDQQQQGTQQYASGGYAGYNLGGYSDGGRLLRGPGDGVSDSIPASIGDRQPARLADGEFVVPARIVSELGNGSTDAGARKLYGMMDRVQKQRSKTMGKGKVAVNSKADKYMPV